MNVCFHSSRYWFFNTQIDPSWIPNNEVRNLLKAAAAGKSSLKEEIIDVLRSCVKGIFTDGSL